MRLTEQEYKEHVKQLAEAIAEDKDTNPDWRDSIHESVDFNELMINSRHHASIIYHSESSDAYRFQLSNEDLGRSIRDGGVPSLNRSIAFYAMYQDVCYILQQITE